MSTESSLDPRLIEETKQQIQGLVREIAQLTKQELTPEQFYAEFLPRVVSALAAIGGAIWTLEDEGRLALQYQMNLQQTNLHDDQEGQIRHGRLLRRVLTNGEAALVPPHSGAGDESEGANPTNFLLVLGPLQSDKQILGVVEIFQRSDSPPATQRGYLRFLMQMCDLAGDYLKTRQLRHFSDRQVLWGQLEEFTRTVHSSLDPRETAYVIANEGRRLIECDRVSVAIRRGKKRCRIEAVSGQDMFDKRSNTVALLNRLASAVVATGDPVWYTGDTTDMAPQVEDAIQDYVDDSHSKTVAVLPLKRPRRSEEVDPSERDDEPEQKAIGALIVEQIEDSRIPESMIQRVDVVTQHSSTALANAMEHNSLFLMPVWRTIGKTRVITKTRNLPWTVLILGVLLVVIGCLVFVPADFELKSKGTLEPVLKRDLFASLKGTVYEVNVRHGDPIVAARGIEPRYLFSVSPDLQKGLPVNREAGDLSSEWLAAFQDNGIPLTGIPSGHTGDDNDAKAFVRQEKEGRWRITGVHGDTEALVGYTVYRRDDGPEGGPQLDVYEEDQVLARLESNDLDVQTEEIDGEMKSVRERRLSVQRLLSNSQLPREEQNRLAGELAELEQRSQSLRKQRDHLEKKRQELEITSPITGQLVTWDVEDRLINRPVQPGEVLMSVADPTQDWQLELQMAEDRMGHILGAQQEFGDDLPVEFILATDPGTPFEGSVKEVHLAAEVRGEEGNTVLIKVKINKQELLQQGIYLRPGATVTGKVYCGRRSIGFVWFHDLIAFVQSRILFPW